MEGKEVCTFYNELETDLETTGNINEDMDKSEYDKQIKVLRLDLNSTIDSQRNAALHVLRSMADKNIHSIQRDGLDLLSIPNIDPKLKNIILTSLRVHSLKKCLRDMNVTELALLNAEWNTTDAPQFATTLAKVISDAQYKKYSEEILFDCLIPFILDINNIQSELESRINLAIEFASAIPYSDLTEKKSEVFISTADTYIETISQMRVLNSNHWYKLWIFLVKLLGTKLHGSLNIINKLLRVVENAFRSSSNEQRLQGYDCWKELINNASLNINHLSSSRQLKLILTPLKAKFSKREPLVNKRFELFVYLLEKLQDRAVLVLNDFFEFCFGEIGDTNHTKKYGFVKRLPELWVRSAQVLLIIIGHSHDENEKCLSTETGIKLSSPIVNSNNIESVFSHVLMAVSECSKLFEDVELDLDRNRVVKCLWGSLLNILLNANQTETFLPALGSVLDNLLKDRDPYCQSIASIIFEETIAIDASKSLVLVLNQLENFLNIIFSVPLMKERCKDVKLFLAMLENLNATDRAEVRTSISNSFIKCKTVEQNVDYLKEVWIYAVRELENYPVNFLLWPVLYLHQLGQGDTVDLLVYHHYKQQLVPFVEKSDEQLLAFFKQLDKTMKNNPLLVNNVLNILALFPPKVHHKEITSITLDMLASILLVPMAGCNKEHLVAEIMRNLLVANIANISDSTTIQNVCTCIETILRQKNYLVLHDFENLLKEIPEGTKLLYMKSLDVDRLMDVYSEEGVDAKTSETLLRIVKILEPEKPSKIRQDSTPVLPLKGRSAKIAKLVKEMPQSPMRVSPKSDVLTYFGKNIDTHSPVKMIGSQLMKNQVKSPKSPKTPTSQKKNKKQTRIDDESNSKFVLIETEVKVDKHKLTVHQIETLKKRREDIPALYQDLSQNASQSFDSTPVVSSTEADCFKNPNEINVENTAAKTNIAQGNDIPENIREKLAANSVSSQDGSNYSESDKVQCINQENGTSAEGIEEAVVAVAASSERDNEKVANIEEEKKIEKKVVAIAVSDASTESSERDDETVANIEKENGAPADQIEHNVVPQSDIGKEATKVNNDEHETGTLTRKVATESGVKKRGEVTDEATGVKHDSGITKIKNENEKSPRKKVGFELKKLSMNIVGADEFFSVGSKRKRRIKNFNEKEMQKNAVTHVTADSLQISRKKNDRSPKNGTSKRNKHVPTGRLSESPTSRIDPQDSQSDFSEMRQNLSSSALDLNESRITPDDPELQISSKHVNETDPKKTRKSERKSTSQKFVEFKAKTSRAALKSLEPEGNLENEEPKVHKNIDMKNMNDTTVEESAVISNGETKMKKGNLTDGPQNKNNLDQSGRVSTSINRKRKRLSDSDCDEDIIESSQEPSMIKEARVVSNRRSGVVEKHKPSSEEEGRIANPSKRSQRLANMIASIDAVAKGSTLNKNSSPESQKKRKRKSIECNELNSSLSNKASKTGTRNSISDNDDSYLETKSKKTTTSETKKKVTKGSNSISSNNGDDQVGENCISNSERDDNKSEDEEHSKEESNVDLTPKKRRLLKRNETVVRKSLRNQQEVHPKKAIVTSSAKKEISFSTPTLSAEDTIKRTQSQDTQTQDSEPMVTSASDVEVRLDVPQKTLVTESEQEIAEMETASMSLSDASTCVSGDQLKLYINDTLVEDKVIVDNEPNLEPAAPLNDEDESDGIIPDTGIDTGIQMKVDQAPSSSSDSPGRHSSSLPTSPVTGETPNRTTEFLSNTVNISPIGSNTKSSSEEEQHYNPKLVPIALKFDSEDDQITEEPDSTKNSPPKKKPSPEIAAMEVDTDLDGKQTVKDEQNSASIKSAKKLSWIKQPPAAQKLSGRRKISYNMSPSASRIKKLMAKVNQSTKKKESDDTNSEDILTFSREVPSPLAIPKIGILKRKHPDTADDDLSPCAKRKRVNFSDPCTTSKKVFIKDDVGSSQCLFPDDDLDKQFLEVLAANLETNPQTESCSTEVELCISETECSLETSTSSVLLGEGPIYPDLVNCEENIGIISRKLTAPMFVNTLLTKLNNENLKTIGDLARLSEANIVKLPFKAPMVHTVFKALDCYYHKNFKSKGSLDVAVDAAEKESPPKTNPLPEPEKEKLAVNEELSKIVEKAISMNVPPKTICSVVLGSLDQNEVLAWFKTQSKFRVHDLVQKSDYPSLVADISKTLGVPKLIEMLSKSPESSQDVECYINKSVENVTLTDLIEKKSLDEVQVALWENVDKGVYSRNELLQSCFLCKIDLIDLNSFFNKMTVVEVGDTVVNRLATEDYSLFVKRILKHLTAHPEVKLNILNNFEITDLTSNIVQRGTSQQIMSSLTYMFLSADKSKEDLVQIFRLVSDHLVDQLPPSQLMELAIDCLRKIPLK